MRAPGATGAEPPEDDAALAAEYVLRLLDPEQEAECRLREARNRGFAAEAERWRAEFARLDGQFAPMRPPAAVWSRIEVRLFGRRSSALARFWSSAGLWRALAAAAVLAAVYLGAIVPERVVVEPGEQAARLISALASAETDVELLALFEPRAAVLDVSRVTGEAAPGRSLELWVIEGEAAPVSLGVLSDEPRTRVPLAPEIAERIEAGATLAITDEPEGGSPTGEPTGPVVAAGTLTKI